MLSTRAGTVGLGAFAAILAGAILVFYVGKYRDSVQQEQKPVSVLVADDLIPKGTSGDIVASKNMYTVSQIPANRVKDGAITDPDALKGLVVKDEIFPGTQLTESQFDSAASSGVIVKLTGDQRAVSVPLDSAHGLTGIVQTGDRVDVMAGFTIDGADGKQHPVTKTIMTDILVLDAPSTAPSSSIASSNTTQNVTLQVTDAQAADLAFASDYGKLWVSLRPAAGADQQARPPLVTLDTILFGVKPIAITSAYHRLEQRALNGGK
jgi:Flp pilus assembly protein CpaB